MKCLEISFIETELACSSVDPTHWLISFTNRASRRKTEETHSYSIKKVSRKLILHIVIFKYVHCCWSVTQVDEQKLIHSEVILDKAHFHGA